MKERKPMSSRWLAACLLVCAYHLPVSGAAAADGQPPERPDQPASKESPPAKDPPPKETPKEPSAPPEHKKKTEEKKSDTESKPEQKSAPEGKKPEEPVPPPPKSEDAGGKKPVTSPNLTIKLAFMAEPTLFPLDIEVEMDGQKAILRGAVPTDEDKAKAAEVAKTVEGVDSVVNKLTVNAAVQAAWHKKQDEAIAQLVKDRLQRSETLKSVGFDVKAENGVVSLSGKTRYQVIALEAAEAARHVPGVRAVLTTGVQLTGKD